MSASQLQKPLTLEEFLLLPETQPACEYFNGETRQKHKAQIATTKRLLR